MTPFRVELTFSSPVALGDNPIHLDGLIAASVWDLAVASGVDDPLSAIHDLPMEKTETTDSNLDWVWKASQFVLEANSPQFVDYAVRRYALREWSLLKDVFETRRDKIPLKQGHQKAIMIAIRQQWIKRAVAWGIGDIDHVRFLLTRLHSFGLYRRMGYGRIRSISVEPASSDEVDLWRCRNLPQSRKDLTFEGHCACTGPIAPPYWDRSRWTACYTYAANAL